MNILAVWKQQKTKQKKQQLLTLCILINVWWARYHICILAFIIPSTTSNYSRDSPILDLTLIQA